MSISKVSGRMLQDNLERVSNIAIDTDTVYVHPTTAGNKHIPAGGAAGQILRWSADGAATWGADVDTDTNTWNANSKDVAGYVAAPGAVANKVWKTDALGNPAWRDDADTDTDTNTVTQIRRENADGTTSATDYRTGNIRLRQGTNVTIAEVSAGIFQISSSYVDTDTNTWDANTKTVAGYVSAPGDVANKVWKTDGPGNPGWRDDADTDTNTWNANSKTVGTVVIGAYTKAERQNEFVTTGTDSTTNKSQSIIQKFKNKALATAAGAFQEIFTDASSGRLTIFASSIYQFRIQINAIEATGFKCKTWEIVGGIKRNASSSTTMMGGAPTYYITSEDSGTSNWDVRVTADDTNEALKIEVKHDSANNVTFSATVWATETRL